MLWKLKYLWKIRNILTIIGKVYNKKSFSKIGVLKAHGGNFMIKMAVKCKIIIGDPKNLSRSNKTQKIDKVYEYHIEATLKIFSWFFHVNPLPQREFAHYPRIVKKFVGGKNFEEGLFEQLFFTRKFLGSFQFQCIVISKLSSISKIFEKRPLLCSIRNISFRKREC